MNHEWMNFVLFVSWNLFLFHGMRGLMTARQFSWILTLFASLVLTPIGLSETLALMTDSSNLLFSMTEEFRRQIHIFYLAYAVADSYLGICYYGQYFPWLSGVVHHGVSGLYVLEKLSSNHLQEMPITMIVETSTILLSLHRIFYSDARIRWIYRHIFPIVFLIFRIICPTIILYHDRMVITPSTRFLFMPFIILNIYWLYRILIQRYKNMI